MENNFDEMKMFHNLDLIQVISEKQDTILDQLNKMMEGKETLNSDARRKREIALMNNLHFIISNTCCKLPDTKAIVHDIAIELSNNIKPLLKDLPLTVEHRHFMVGALWDLANEVAQKWIRNLLITIVFLVCVVGCSIFWYYNSNAYWNGQYMKVANSKVLSKDEIDFLKRQNLLKDDDIAFPLSLASDLKKEIVSKMKYRIKSYRRSDNQE